LYLVNVRMLFSIIVTCDLHGAFLNLPWNIPEDAQQFIKLVTFVESPAKINALIMDKHTWNTLPTHKRRMGRMNIVISSSSHSTTEYEVFNCLDEALYHLNAVRHIVDRVFVIGGKALYKKALRHPDIESVYLTIIHDFATSYSERSDDVYFHLKYLSDWFIEDDSKYSGTMPCVPPISHHVWHRNTEETDRLRLFIQKQKH
jgi:dihydrofolate reductase